MKNNINEKLEDKSAKKAELEKQWFARQITTKEFQDSMNALDGIKVVNGVIMNDSIQLPIEDARIIRDMFTELISFDESEDHEEPPEYVYRLETQLSNLIGDTANAHMCWEKSNE